MLGHASRLLLLAPALTYGLGAAFIAAAYRLGASPADPSAWQAFLTLAPIIREPVYFVAGLPGFGDMATFAVFVAVMLVGVALVLSPGKTGRTRFIYAHLAFLMLVYSMGKSGVFTAGYPVAGGPSGLYWTFGFSGFPVMGVALFALVVLACGVSHHQILRRMKRQIAAARDIEARLFAILQMPS